MRIDIAIVTYRPGAETERLLSDIPKMTRNHYDLHVWDNTGNPKSLSAAWNDLVMVGRAPLVAILNSDVALSPGWDDRLVDCLRSNLDVGVAIPHPVGVGENDFYGKSFPLKTVPTREHMQEVAAWVLEKAEGGLYDFSLNDPAAFYAFMVRRWQFEEMKGFDERLRFYGQDHDFQDRLRIRRLRSVRVNSCVLFHGASESTKKACESGDIDIMQEYRHIGKVLPYLRSGTLKRWDDLSEQERSQIRNDSAYRIPTVLK